jgi:hypothetical protein
MTNDSALAVVSTHQVVVEQWRSYCSNKDKWVEKVVQKVWYTDVLLKGPSRLLLFLPVH